MLLPVTFGLLIFDFWLTAENASRAYIQGCFARALSPPLGNVGLNSLWQPAETTQLHVCITAFSSRFILGEFGEYYAIDMCTSTVSLFLGGAA